MKCANCGAELQVGSVRCSVCGEEAQIVSDYNILEDELLQEMLKNPRVIGVKNSSMPVQDIQMWRDEGALVFNGPDEQLFSGLAAGAAGGIGGHLIEEAVVDCPRKAFALRLEYLFLREVQAA